MNCGEWFSACFGEMKRKIAEFCLTEQQHDMTTMKACEDLVYGLVNEVGL